MALPSHPSSEEQPGPLVQNHRASKGRTGGQYTPATAAREHTTTVPVEPQHDRIGFGILQASIAQHHITTSVWTEIEQRRSSTHTLALDEYVVQVLAPRDGQVAAPLPTR